MNQPQTHSQSVATQQGALQAAMLKANEKEIAKTPAPITANNTAPSALQSVICRKDILGNMLVFAVDTHTKTADGEFISYWDGKGATLKTAPIQYYRVAKPVPAEEAAKMTADYAKAMKLSQIHLRQRLVKEAHAPRSEDGSISVEAQNEWKANMKAKFKAAFDKAIDEAFASM